jgi:hypothetical protein
MEKIKVVTSEKTKKYMKQYREEHHAELMDWQREYRKTSEYKDRRLKEYGITFSDYQKLFESQGGKCAICGKHINKRLCVDHDHLTNAVRGLLCTSCNLGLGYFYDDPEIVKSALEYLMKTKKENKNG